MSASGGGLSSVGRKVVCQFFKGGEYRDPLLLNNTDAMVQ
jgi:hypothetical protein